MFTFVSGAQGCFLFAFGLSVELVGAKRKTLIGNLIQAPFAFGEAFVALFAMGIRENHDALALGVLTFNKKLQHCGLQRPFFRQINSHSSY